MLKFSLQQHVTHMVLVYLALFTYLPRVRLVSKVHMGIAVAAAIVLRQQLLQYNCYDFMHCTVNHTADGNSLVIKCKKSAERKLVELIITT